MVMNAPSPTPSERPNLAALVKKHGKRTGIFLVGWAIVAAGIAMLVLPGPGLVVIVAGLSVLAIEFAWARRWRDRAHAKATAAAKKTKTMVTRNSSNQRPTDDGGTSRKKDIPPDE
jgi:uncharacterized protein (TIGR02611 family)